MKRLNVREFRKNVSSLTEEPIEVVRYSETIGFWVPQGMTLEPRTKPRVSRSTRKPKVVTRGTVYSTSAELDEMLRRVRKFKASLPSLDGEKS